MSHLSTKEKAEQVVVELKGKPRQGGAFGYSQHAFNCDVAAIEAALDAQAAQVWKDAADDLAHGLPKIWAEALKERCKFKAKQAAAIRQGVK